MSQVLVLGAELGADLRAIAIVQSIRVAVIAVGLPAGLAVLGLVGHARPRVTAVSSVAVLDELAILIMVSSVVAIIAYRFRFPGGLLFRRHADLCGAAWKWADPYCYVMVGCARRHACDGRGDAVRASP